MLSDPSILALRLRNRSFEDFVVYSFFHESLVKDPRNPGRKIRRVTIQRLPEDVNLQRMYSTRNFLEKIVKELEGFGLIDLSLYYKDHLIIIDQEEGSGNKFEATRIEHAIR